MSNDGKQQEGNGILHNILDLRILHILDYKRFKHSTDTFLF